MRQLLSISSLALCVGLWIVTASACGGDDASGLDGADTSSAAGVDDDASTGTQDSQTGDDASASDPATDDAVSMGGDAAGPAPEGGQCTEEEIAFVDTMNLEGFMGECTMQCVMSGAAELTECVAECVAEDTPLSLECAGCFGLMAQCVMSECGDVCPLDVDGCNTCAETNCSADFQTCMGVDTNGPSAMFCMNPPDQQALEAGALDDMTSCLPGCFAADATAECFGTCASDQGLSIPCSGCFTDLGTCTFETCADDCTAESFEGEGCRACLSAYCEPSFEGCSGTPFFDDEEQEPVEGGLCDDAADLAALLADDTLLSGCVASCAVTDTDGDCLSACLTEAGVSAGCAGCLSPLQACTAANCAVNCTVDSDDPQCGQCMDEYCAAERESCFADQCPICPETHGACMNDEDGPLMGTLQETIGVCTGTCADDADPLACSTQCLADAGLSEGCSGCMAVLAACTVEQCGASCNPQAQAEDGGAACVTCAEASCGAESTACFGADGGPGLPGAGSGPACVNEQDSSLLTSDSDPKGVCEVACIDSADQTVCLTTCLEQAGFSPSCSGCIGVLSACVFASCAEACNGDATDEQCQTCVAQECSAEEAACYQGEGGPGADAMCGGSTDQGIMEANPSLIETCMGMCMPDPNTAEACLTDCFMDLGLSDGCSGCVSWMLGCTLTECSDACDNTTDPDACSACAEAQCAEEIEACYGAQQGGGDPGGTGPGPGDPGDPGTGSEGLCSDQEDSALLQSQPGLSSICGQQCFTADDQSTCVGDCLFTGGLSESCAYCMGDLITCSMANCLSECMGGGPECQTCTNQMCTEYSVACYGGQP
jgi:hypothetical protein